VDTFTGSGNNDAYIADNTGTDVTSTADSINGGAGTDTLLVYSDGAAAGLPSLTSVETLNVYDQDATIDISASTLASVTTANFIRGDGVAITVGTNVATVGLSDIVLAEVSGTTDDTVVNFAATRTSATLNLSGITTAAGDTDEDLEVNGAALTTINLNATDVASSFDLLDLAAATTINVNAAVALSVTSLATTGTATLNIAGAGAVSLGTLDGDIDTVTSTGSGAITAAIGAAVDTVITGGSGNDVITASTADTILSTDTLAVNAGAGTGDVLVIEATADVNTAADAARYTGFDILRLTGNVTQVASLFTDLTGLQIISGATVTTGLNAATAANVTARADVTTTTLALTDASGTSDVVSINLGTGLTSTEAVDSGVLTLTGFETINLTTKSGPTASAGAVRVSTIAGFDAINANEINLSGTSFDITDIANQTGTRVKALTVNASALVGDGQTGNSNTGLTLAGSAYVGSTINGSSLKDVFDIGAEGSTYNGNAGRDSFTTTIAIITPDGTTDAVINGGDGLDTLTLSDTTTTLTDANFTYISGMETLALTNTSGNASLTVGAAFNTAFATGATITTGLLAATKDITFAGGLLSVPVTLTVEATELSGAATETNSITTGSANDTVTFTGDATYVGVSAAAAQGTIVIDTRAGDDTISVTVGTIASDDATGGQAISITGGKGKDTITKVGTNDAELLSVTYFNFASGDSTVTAWDEITGFDRADTTFSDVLYFGGSAAVSAFSNTEDVGVIKSHSITNGLATFDDIANFTTALVINSANLADVVGYLALNTATNGTVAFAYDSDSSGSADGMMVYYNTTIDNLVLLVGLTGTTSLSVSLDATTAGTIAID